MQSNIDQMFLKLINCWSRLENGSPYLSWDGHSGFAISDHSGNIWSSSYSIESAVQLAIEFSEEDLQEKKKELLSKAQELIKRANSL